jgi:hypothetical protein
MGRGTIAEVLLKASLWTHWQAASGTGPPVESASQTDLTASGGAPHVVATSPVTVSPPPGLDFPTRIIRAGRPLVPEASVICDEWLRLRVAQLEDGSVWNMIDDALTSGSCALEMAKHVCHGTLTTNSSSHVLDFLAQFKRLRYVHIGAHTADDFLHSEGTRTPNRIEPIGLLVEPIRAVYDKIEKHPANVYEHAAIWTTSGSCQLYTVDAAVDPVTGIDVRTGVLLHKWITQISSMSRSFFEDQFEMMCEGRAKVEDYMRVEHVPCLSIRDLLSKHPQFAEPDVVIIDAEGGDLTILLQFDLRHTVVVIYESTHMSADEQATAATFVRSHGLTTVSWEFGNTMAVRQTVVAGWCTEAVSKEWVA